MIPSRNSITRSFFNQAQFLILSGSIVFAGLLGVMHQHDHVESGWDSQTFSADSAGCSCAFHTKIDNPREEHGGPSPDRSDHQDDCMFCKILAEHHFTVIQTFELELKSDVAEFVVDGTRNSFQISALSPNSRGPPIV